jgi:hypothetical protein
MKPREKSKGIQYDGRSGVNFLGSASGETVDRASTAGKAIPGLLHFDSSYLT